MRRYFENPEMKISTFDMENVVTEVSAGYVKDQVENGSLTLNIAGGDATTQAAVGQILSFNFD